MTFDSNDVLIAFLIIIIIFLIVFAYGFINAIITVEMYVVLPALTNIQIDTYI